MNQQGEVAKSLGSGTRRPRGQRLRGHWQLQVLTQVSHLFYLSGSLSLSRGCMCLKVVRRPKESMRGRNSP